MARVTVNLPDIEGYEDTGEYRIPYCGELYRICKGPMIHRVGVADEIAPMRRHFILRKIPWRAEYGQYYHYVCSDAEVYRKIEEGGDVDDERYEIGNYFRCAKDAHTVRDEVLSFFKNLKENV